MDYYIKIASVNKAKEDVDHINSLLGFINLVPERLGKGGVARFMTKLLGCIRIITWMKRGDVLHLQYPMKKFYYLACLCAHAKGAKVVTLIHDLGAFRRHKLTPEQENKRLSKTDFLIVHNQTMKEYLIKQGYKGGIHNLEIFDYLSSRKTSSYNKTGKNWKIVYAGNLGKWRNEFLYKIDMFANDWALDLYGKGFLQEEYKGEKLTYHGYMNSDDFIGSIKADFGLVWDGDSENECRGDWGEYLKINNPHKTSFYIRAGIPVIVWSKAAMAPFVKEANIGVVVDTLYDIDKILNNMTEEEYQAKKQAALDMSRLLNDGYYIKEGYNNAHKYIGK